MARPERHDVDYFPFVVKDGRTLNILEGKYGCRGTGFFTNVMRFLCTQPDHHFQIADEADRMYFFAKTKCDEKTGMEMLDIMSKTRKLHSQLWVSYAVIACPDLLDSLADAYRNRTNPIISIDDILVSYVDNPQAGEFLTSETHKEEDNQRQSYVNNPQTKLNYTKLKESIGNPALETPKRKKRTLPLDFCISPQVRKWATEKGYENLNQHLEAFIGKAKANGYQYIDWDQAFMNAIRDDWGRVNEKGNGGNGKPPPTPASQSDPFTRCPSCKREVLETDRTEFACYKCEKPDPKAQAKINAMVAGIGKEVLM